ncbi:MAG: Ser-Thr-rich GPI-anchored membrane family protein [Spirochaetia bacterium]
MSLLGASITVVAPNGGEEFAQGSERTIRWDASRVDGEVTIRLLAGGTELLVIAQVPAVDGSYAWTVSLAVDPGSGYRIGIEAAGDPEVSDESDADFTISPPAPWTLILGGAGDESANDLAILPDGDIILAGYASDTAGGAQDVYLVRLNALGGIEWEARYSDTNSETTKAVAVAAASDGGFVVARYTYDHDSSKNDIYLMKADSDGTFLGLLLRRRRSVGRSARRDRGF